MFKSPTGRLSKTEFVTVMALMTSLVALAIDAMLPALGDMAQDLHTQNDNDRQLVIGVLFLGLSIGQLVFGPVSDSSGRKPLILFGVCVFVLGCFISAYAQSFGAMLIGRFLQGLGAAAPRNIIVAMIRDCYKGDAMAQITSLIMSVFILVPMVAPSLGQIILWWADWRAIFIALLIFAIVVQLWFAARQPETLAVDKRRSLTLKALLSALCEVCKDRSAMAYALASSLIFGAFIGYLSTSQQIFQEQYGVGDAFSLYFALIAASLGLASYFNSRWVMRLGMRYLTRRALALVCLASLLYGLLALFYQGQPPFLTMVLYFVVVFFPVGILFGNLNALAMESLGHIAGMASSVIGSITTLLSLLLGATIGRFYNDTLMPIIWGFSLLSLLALLVCWRALSYKGPHESGSSSL